MSIRTKTILFLGIATIILVGTMVVTANLVILQGYRTLEGDFAQRNLKRAVNVLAAAQEKLYATAGDYSSWDATYHFVAHPGDKAYRKENFIASSFGNININAMLFYNTAGTLVAQAYAADAGSIVDSVPPALLDAVRSIKGIIPASESFTGRSGIIAVASKPVMIAARPILTNQSKGPARGTLVFCRNLDSLEINKLSSIVELPLTISSVGDVVRSPDSMRLRDFLVSGIPQKAFPVDRTTLLSCVWIPDVSGKNSFILSYYSPRDIYRSGLRASYYSISWLIAIVAVFSLIIILVIELSVLSRFIRLRQAIDTIKASPEQSRRLPVSGKDEITALTADINLMLSAIELAQKRADSTERQYRLLFEQMLNGFALFEAVRSEQGVNDDYRFLEVNPSFERLTGLSRVKCSDRSLHETLPDLAAQWIEHLAQVKVSGTPRSFECYSVSMGKHFEVLAFKAGDERCGVTFTDSTSRKKAEEERAKVREDLAQAQKMQAIGQLAGGIAHDFNNQLAAILGYAELLQGNLKGDAKLRTYADRVIAGINRAADLTSKLLAFAHKGKYIERPVNMHSIISEVAALLERSIDRRISIELQLKAPEAVTLGDPTQLQNVILNLGLNGRDAMPEGGTLTFATDIRVVDAPFRTRHSSTVTPGRYLMISVSDTGTGIDPETQKHLFEPFFTTKPMGKGTGMGLAASYGAVTHHNGTITVYSEINRGTIFNVYLPLHSESKETVPPMAHVTQIPGNPRVLIVDDESMVADMANELLTTMGCTSRLCSNGREAIELYRTSWKEFDVILLDMVMPEMNGTDTFKQMKAVNPQVKVIISSGYSMNNEAQTLLNLGARTFIQKPYTRQTLAKAILNTMEK
jgi:signal transduction histidine kinase/sensor domain CHASE-containing protein/ActR/RegA family two-component response regulator